MVSCASRRDSYSSGGSEFTLSVGDRKLEGKTVETGAWTRFVPQALGRIRIEMAGQFTLTVQPRTPPKWKSMGLQVIVLRPAK